MYSQTSVFYVFVIINDVRLLILFLAFLIIDKFILHESCQSSDTTSYQTQIVGKEVKKICCDQ